MAKIIPKHIVVPYSLSFTKEHYKNINKRPSSISSSKEVFDEAITFYPKALKKKWLPV